MAKKRRQKGTGGITRTTRTVRGRKYVLWRATLELPPGPDGKRRRATATRAKYADAVKALQELRTEKLKQGDIATSVPTVADWADTWLEQIRDTIKPNTWKGYRQRIRDYALPCIGKKRIDRVNPADITAIYTEAIRNGRQGSIPQIQRSITPMFAAAIAAGHLTRNVADSQHAPTKRLSRTATTREPPALGDAVKVLKVAMEDDQLRARWAVAFFTGLRTGEVLGLQRESVDVEAESLVVSWQLQRIPAEHGCNPGGQPTCGKRWASTCPQAVTRLPAAHEHRQVKGQYYLQRPKSATSRRVLPLVEPLRGLLLQAREDAHGPEGLLWAGVDGGLWTPERDGTAWKKLVASAGVAHFDLHTARHLAASLLMRSDVPQPVVSKILGHAGGAITRHYQHASEDDMRAALQALAGVLSI